MPPVGHRGPREPYLMSVSNPAAAETAFSPASLIRAGRLFVSLALVVAAVIFGTQGGVLAALAAGLLAAITLAVAPAARPDSRAGWLAPSGIGVLSFLLAWSVNDTMRVWQAPPTWHEALAFSPVGGGLAVALLLGANLPSPAGRGPPPPWRRAAAIFPLPYLFPSLFLLSAAHLLADLGRFVGIGAWFGWYGEATFGRVLLLLLFNEIVIVGGGWLMDGRWSRSWRLRVLLLVAALFASLTPQVARLGSGEAVAALPVVAQIAALPVIAAVALAGLWAQTFLLTGVMLDAIRGRRPTYAACAGHWWEGASKGGVYSFVFMLLVHLAALFQTPGGMALVASIPGLVAIAAGVLLFPVARTIIESFDGSAPFVRRLRANSVEPLGYARGLVIGIGVAIGIALDETLRDPGFRFVFGAVVGAAAYAGIDLLRHAWAIRT